jgi:hypothetical protein
MSRTISYFIDDLLKFNKDLLDWCELRKTVIATKRQSDGEDPLLQEYLTAYNIFLDISGVISKYSTEEIKS